MKKFVSYVFLILLVLIPLKVNAQEYKEKELIPVDTSATVKTEKFDYNDFIYSSSVDSNGNSLIRFGSVKNNNVNKSSVSIDLLLFDNEQKNIGRVYYCTDLDISSNYAGFKLQGGQSAPFSINVVSKYFVDGKSAKDVKYIAVYDDNKYCKTGGFSNYEGLTIDEIVNGVRSGQVSGLQKLIAYIKEHNYQTFIIYGLVGLVILIIYGMIINAMHNKIYAKTTSLAYIPGFNLYVTVKMAFGKIVGFIYLILLLGAGILYYLGIPFILFIVLGIAILALIIDIIKMVTKKYDMLCLEPSIKASTFKLDDSASTTITGNSVADQALDLSYDDDGLKNDDLTLDDEVDSDKEEDNKDEGESDLKKFFN